MAAGPIGIQQGAVGQVGALSIGVGAVAPDGSGADIVLADTVAGVAREVQLAVRLHDVVPAGGQGLVVSAIAAPTDAARGRIELTPVVAGAGADPGVPADAVVIAPGGRLRVDGPAVADATDVSVLSVGPDMARIEWLPAAWPREATPAASIHQMEVRAGSTVALGRSVLSVLAIQGDAADHRARLVVRVARATVAAGH